MAVSNVKKESFLRFLNEKHNASEYWSSTFRKDTDATLEGLWEMRVEARLWEVALQKRGVHEELTPIVFAALKAVFAQRPTQGFTSVLPNTVSQLCDVEVKFSEDQRAVLFVDDFVVKVVSGYRGALEFAILQCCQSCPYVVRLLHGRRLAVTELSDLCFPEPRFVLVMPRVQEVALIPASLPTYTSQLLQVRYTAQT